MGRFNVDFEVTNYGDLAAMQLGALAPDKVRRLKLRGVVDSGAARFVLPKRVVNELGLPVTAKVKVRYADGREAVRAQADGAYVEILGRHTVVEAIVEPKRPDALIGAIVLEGMDLLVDCANMCLVPRDPRYEIVELD
jgi:clan AA aspartic protease